MKKLIPAYVMSFVFSFMLFYYEPIAMYMLNFHDFWFDLSIIFYPLLAVTFGLFLVLSLIFTIIYFINKKFNDRFTFYKVCVIMFFVVFVCTYIQGNYMISNLPSLDGNLINWNDYKTESIISVVMWIVVIGIMVFTSIKFKMENVIKTFTLISIAIFVMLVSSLFASIRPHSWDNKILSVATTENYNKASSDKNFVIFLLDAVDSVMFDDVMTKTKQTDLFQDFTYYKDTMSTYSYTRDSIPFILSGVWNENKYPFDVYYNKALDKSVLFKELGDKDYEINLYDNDLLWTTEKSKNVANLVQLDRKIDTVNYLKQQTKYVLFKYLPYPLKKIARIEYLDFNRGKVQDNTNLFTWADTVNYKLYKEESVEKVDNKVFKFIHLEGAHVPFDLDKNLNRISNGTYYKKLEATLTVIEAYINNLKENGIYDNSVIIIMADHGYYIGNGSDGRQNPILFIKGVDEHHDMIRSDIPVSYTDLNDAYIDLLNDKKSTELFSDIPKNRERRLLWYRYLKENHMVEYVQTGKAWNEKTLKKTGKVFDR